MKTHRAVRWLVFASILLSFSNLSFGQVVVGVSVRVAPPALPVYTQPVAPGPGYLWTPGYWAWNDDGGYYWVPGTWVVAPAGLLWTPGYWGFADGIYGWHRGYWGPHIGFYGGVNYGFGYTGSGFGGGEWRGHTFYYNRSVTNITNVTTVYNKTVIVNENHVAFNGGEGGLSSRPSHEEEVAEHEHHREALESQTKHEHMASQNKQNFASANHGRPAVAATAKPGEFHGKGVVAAKSAGAPYKAPAMSPKQARATSKPETKHASNAGPNGKKPEGHAASTSSKNTGASGQMSSKAGNKTNSNHPNEAHTAKASALPSRPSHPAPQPHQNAPKSAPTIKPVAQHRSEPRAAAQPQHASQPAPNQGKKR